MFKPNPPPSLLLLPVMQTDGSVPNTLLIAKCDVVKRRVAAAEHIAKVMYLHIDYVFFFLL